MLWPPGAKNLKFDIKLNFGRRRLKFEYVGHNGTQTLPINFQSSTIYFKNKVCPRDLKLTYPCQGPPGTNIYNFQTPGTLRGPRRGNFKFRSIKTFDHEMATKFKLTCNSKSVRVQLKGLTTRWRQNVKSIAIDEVEELWVIKCTFL